MKDFFSGMLVLIIVFILIIGGSFGYLFLLKPYLNLKREAIQHSQQYVESKQSMMMQLAQEYYAASNAQRAAILERLQLEAERIPAEEIPMAVRSILRGGR